MIRILWERKWRCSKRSFGKENNQNLLYKNYFQQNQNKKDYKYFKFKKYDVISIKIPAIFFIEHKSMNKFIWEYKSKHNQRKFLFIIYFFKKIFLLIFENSIQYIWNIYFVLPQLHSDVTPYHESLIFIFFFWINKTNIKIKRELFFIGPQTCPSVFTFIHNIINVKEVQVWFFIISYYKKKIRTKIQERIQSQEWQILGSPRISMLITYNSSPSGVDISE